ncbi:hypothetical protein TcWFU_006033 [Taenia crassiceps]|uniref:Uncharacterized protein n=1 Tax=Taenia crassiceps TaxID=6207 RepID=A0ABR4Q748_9CEST
MLALRRRKRSVLDVASRVNSALTARKKNVSTIEGKERRVGASQSAKLFYSDKKGILEVTDERGDHLPDKREKCCEVKPWILLMMSPRGWLYCGHFDLLPTFRYDWGGRRAHYILRTGRVIIMWPHTLRRRHQFFALSSFVHKAVCITFVNHPESFVCEFA